MNYLRSSTHLFIILTVFFSGGYITTAQETTENRLQFNLDPSASSETSRSIDEQYPVGTPARDRFVPLVGIPFVDINSAENGLGSYANSLYYAAISIAAVLAVLRIAFAGIKYMLTDIVTQKGQARKDVQNALLGLLIVVGTFLILETINPNLVKLDLLNLDPLSVPQQQRNVQETCSIQSGCSEVPDCPEGSVIETSISNDGNVEYNCASRVPEERNDPPGTSTLNIDYICLAMSNPNGCILRHHFLRSDAEAQCDRLNGDLVDAPNQLGVGICYYIEE